MTADQKIVLATDPQDLAAALRQNHEQDQRPVQVVGRQSETSGDVLVLSTANLARIAGHQAADMTVTVEAGVTWQQFCETLAGAGQYLPIDVADSNATMGGLVASNVCGTRRYGYGSWRDYLIGITAIDAQGRVFRAGGKVVKNVAGYDLCRLLIGSRGTLAILTEMTFKVRPQPEALGGVSVKLPDWSDIDRALEHLVTSQTRPIGIDLISKTSATPDLVVYFDGNKEEVLWQQETVAHELEKLAASIEYSSNPEESLNSTTQFAQQAGAIRCGVRPDSMSSLLSDVNAPYIAHAGNGIAVGCPEAAAELEHATRLGGWFDDGSPHGATNLDRKVRAAFDPLGLLVPNTDHAQ